MPDCINCENAVHDTTWGEKKCEIHQVLIRKIDEEDCEHFKKSDVKEQARSHIMNRFNHVM